jgi:hypothetical protein
MIFGQQNFLYPTRNIRDDLIAKEYDLPDVGAGVED